MLLHRLEIPIGVEQGKPALDAECADKHVHCLPHCHALSAKRAVISGTLDGERHRSHGSKFKAAKQPLQLAGRCFITCALKQFRHDEIANNDWLTSE
jgi:hypothetical protein